ncbi:vitamin D 25-hydroxylase [Caerostris darwini]|uniref:Vitamin D 25-hydroxylase n=1 Tax=Caerostris darwini TaxID=1538125 RepID=A0AAV4UEQ4_9ARAC|nr:vitamin D 25-hydroxylase [Caerostris darwini]
MDYSEYFRYYAMIGIVVLFIIYQLINSKKKLNLPPGPISLPIVGYLPFLGSKPYEKFEELSKKYGNIYKLRLGMSLAVIITDFEILKEAFSKSATLDKPLKLYEIMPDGLGLTSINGTKWAEQRKITMKIMKDLGLGKSKWQDLIQEEVDAFIRQLEKQKGEPCNVQPALSASLCNNMFSLIFGYHLTPDHPKMTIIRNLLTSFPKVFRQTGLHCLIPTMIGFFQKMGINFNSDIEDILIANLFIREEIENRKNTDSTDGTTYVSGYLNKMREDKLKGGNSYNDINLRGNIQSLIIGGTNTTTVTLTWLFFAMASYPKIQQKVFEEVDDVLGKCNKPQWANRARFPYTYATIMECMRWRTLLSVNFHRITNEDIKICGYDIPKNTIIIAVLASIHNDSKYWKTPEKFIPERFLDEDGILETKQEAWVPFSYGKRNCPAEVPAMMTLLLYFTNVIQKFSVLPETEQQPDLDGIPHFVLSPKIQKLRFIPRT